MTALTFPRRSLLPRVASELFDANSFFPPRIWDFDGDFFEMEFFNKMPAVNVIDNGKEYRFELAAPGLERKDFKVELIEGMLTISAEKKEESKEEQENFTRREFSFNRFSRTFRLPENCLLDALDAKYENGVLRLTLPKKEVVQQKAIKEIKVS